MSLSSYYGRSSLCQAIEEWGEPDLDNLLVDAEPPSSRWHPAVVKVVDGRIMTGRLCKCGCKGELTYKEGTPKQQRNRAKFKRGHYAAMMAR